MALAIFTLPPLNTAREKQKSPAIGGGFLFQVYCLETFFFPEAIFAEQSARIARFEWKLGDRSVAFATLPISLEHPSLPLHATPSSVASVASFFSMALSTKHTAVIFRLER